MKLQERDKLIRQVHQSIYGVAGTEDKGMAGDVKTIKDCLNNVKKDVTKNTAWRKDSKGMVGGLFAIIISAIVTKVQGWW